MPTTIPLAGVIGDPIAHSKSPQLHSHWLERYAIAGHYVPLEIKREDFESALRLLAKMGFRGVNVTIPHKELALQCADTVTDRAALIGAANTLTFSGKDRIQADNTDGYGFVENLRQRLPDWQPATGPALVLGAGGASRAVLTALLTEGVPQIYLANRTRARAERLQELLGARIELVDWAQAPALFPELALIVNTTSLGMKGQPPFNMALGGLRAGTIATDIIYNPLHTEFLRSAEQEGCRIVDGLGMLLHQATPGFERWFGKKPEVDETLRRAVLQG